MNKPPSLFLYAFGTAVMASGRFGAVHLAAARPCCKGCNTPLSRVWHVYTQISTRKFELSQLNSLYFFSKFGLSQLNCLFEPTVGVNRLNPIK